MLESAIAEIEAHVHGAGWDRGPVLFALVRAARFSADDPETAQRLGVDRLGDDALTPIEQDELSDQPLDELLAGIAWPASVAGCAVSQEIVILPPSAEAELHESELAARAPGHPERREARLVVGVLRDGSSAALLRMRAAPSGDGDADGAGAAGTVEAGAVETGAIEAGGVDDLLTGPDLAPHLVAALLATFD